MEEQAQHLIDATTAAFKAGKIANNPFAQPGKGVAIPPPAQLTMGQRPGAPGAPGMMPPSKYSIYLYAAYIYTGSTQLTRTYMKNVHFHLIVAAL
jgi:hypothetical protein